jgi:putative hydrolase of the HAD superfamily
MRKQMNHSKCECVIFDLDYTLYNEESYFKLAFEDIAEVVSKNQNISYEGAYNQILSEFFDKGSQFDKFFDYVSRMFDLDSSYHKQFYQLYLTTDGNLSLYSDADDILGWLNNKEYRLGIITNGSVDAQRNKIELLNLKPRFDNICICREIGQRYEKPHSRPYKEVLNDLNISAEHSVYVGDNPHTDFRGAKEVGMATIRLRRGEFSNDDSKADSIDFEIDNHREIKTLLSE